MSLRVASTLALMTAFSACANPLVLEPAPAWHGACIDTSRTRVEAALRSVSLLKAQPLEIAGSLLSSLPQQERRAIRAASALAASELGHSPSTQDLIALRPISWRAFYGAFADQGYCSLPEDRRFLAADFFVDALFVYLTNQGIISDTTFLIDGAPTIGQEAQRELMSWLIIAASQAPPNNSIKPNLLRKSAYLGR